MTQTAVLVLRSTERLLGIDNTADSLTDPKNDCFANCSNSL